jgi:uncharacterized membrane protein YedE/YeeE
MKTRALPLAAGLLFAVGLAVSGMTQPSKVIAFLDFAGAWDPSLAFVMVGAIGVYLLVHRGLVLRRERPIYARRFSVPTTSAIDARLITGAAIFGVGWGLSGFCPGPALVSFGAGIGAALWFVPGVLAGMALFHVVGRVWAGSDG